MVSGWVVGAAEDRGTEDSGKDEGRRLDDNVRLPVWVAFLMGVARRRIGTALWYGSPSRSDATAESERKLKMTDKERWASNFIFN